MSFFPDLTPLIEQIKQFNLNQKELSAKQAQTNQLLTEIKEILLKNYAINSTSESR